LYVGLELDRLGVTARLLALAYAAEGKRAQIQWSDLYTGKETLSGKGPALPQPAEAIETARAELAKLPLFLALGAPEGWQMSNLETALAAIAPEPGSWRPVLAVVDFLQLVAPEPDARGDLRETIRTAAYRARAIARDRNACVVLVSSTARGEYNLLQGEDAKGNGRDEFDKLPESRFLGTGKESGEIEYAADLALVLCRKRWKEGDALPPVWCAVAKQRTGKPAWVQLCFDGAALTDPAARAAESTPKGGKYGLGY